MPVFTVEVVEVVVYRGTVEAPTEEEAKATAVADLLAHSGGGKVVFHEVADRTASVITE
jgi:hypothetical protein